MAGFGKKCITWPISIMLWFKTRGKAKPDLAKIEQMNFSTSTRKMGLRFTERMRDRWRKRWLKLKR